MCAFMILSLLALQVSALPVASVTIHPAVAWETVAPTAPGKHGLDEGTKSALIATTVGWSCLGFAILGTLGFVIYKAWHKLSKKFRNWRTNRRPTPPGLSGYDLEHWRQHGYVSGRVPPQGSALPDWIRNGRHKAPPVGGNGPTGQDTRRFGMVSADGYPNVNAPDPIFGSRR